MVRKIRKTLKSGGRKLNKKKVNKRTQKKQKKGGRVDPYRIPAVKNNETLTHIVQPQGPDNAAPFDDFDDLIGDLRNMINNVNLLRSMTEEQRERSLNTIIMRLRQLDNEGQIQEGERQLLELRGLIEQINNEQRNNQSGGRKKYTIKCNKNKYKKQKGGIKKVTGGIDEGIKDGDYSIKVVWKGKYRVIYTYDPNQFGNYNAIQSQSQGTESSTDTKSGRKIITLEEFGKDDTFDKLTEELEPDVRYIFVIVFEDRGRAKMYLGDQSYNHDELSHDELSRYVGVSPDVGHGTHGNWILAAGELRMVLDEHGKNKLIINNQSGHYKPDMPDVINVTTDFFGKGINIKFEPYNETQSQSSQGSYGSYGGKRSRKNKKSRKVKIIRR